MNHLVTSNVMWSVPSGRIVTSDRSLNARRSGLSSAVQINKVRHFWERVGHRECSKPEQQYICVLEPVRIGSRRRSEDFIWSFTRPIAESRGKRQRQKQRNVRPISETHRAAAKNNRFPGCKFRERKNNPRVFLVFLNFCFEISSYK